MQKQIFGFGKIVKNMKTEIEITKNYGISVFIYANKTESYSIVIHADKIIEDSLSYELYCKGLYIGRIYKSVRNNITINNV
jgi:hypothetical protein